MSASRILLLVVLAGLCSTANAHHVFEAEFDAKAPVQLKGKITKVELINPHAWIHIQVTTEKGAVQDWAIEAGSPNVLFRRGVTQDTLKVGTEVLVRGYQSRDRSCNPECKANGRDITLSNKQELFIGTTGTGAPWDK